MAAEIFQLLQDSAVAHAISKSHYIVGAILQVFHIFGLILLLAAVTLINLRLLGLGLRRQSLAQVAASSTSLLWTGLVIAVASGLPMFVSAAVKYAGNSAFWLKIALLVVAVLLQLLLQRALIPAHPRQPVLGRVAALGSLLLWFGVASAGRAIGFL